MNSNYFYDINYVSPHRYYIFEYAKLDTDQKVDFSIYYDDGMLDAGFFDSEGLEFLNKYRAVRAPYSSYPSLALEFDCESKIPAFFTRIHFIGHRAEETLEDLATILNVPTPSLPPVTQPVHFDEVGIYPERNNSLMKFCVRSYGQGLKDFADQYGCINTDIITSVPHPPMNTSINFNWNGTTMSHFTFAAPDLGVNDPWVQQVTQHNAQKLSEKFVGLDYSVQRGVKIALCDDYPEGYMKAYFIVRAKSR
jgi:hypothetical protein